MKSLDEIIIELKWVHFKIEKEKNRLYHYFIAEKKHYEMEFEDYLVNNELISAKINYLYFRADKLIGAYKKKLACG